MFLRNAVTVPLCDELDDELDAKVGVVADKNASMLERERAGSRFFETRQLKPTLLQNK